MEDYEYLPVYLAVNLIKAQGKQSASSCEVGIIYNNLFAINLGEKNHTNWVPRWSLTNGEVYDLQPKGIIKHLRGTVFCLNGAYQQCSQ